MLNVQQPLYLIKRLFLAFVLFTVSTYSMAHTRMVQSVPAVDAKLLQSPSHLQFAFADPVILASVQLHNQQQQINLQFKPSPHLNRQFQIVIPPLKKGLYTVQWKTLGADGHAMNGAYNFTIK